MIKAHVISISMHGISDLLIRITAVNNYGLHRQVFGKLLLFLSSVTKPNPDNVPFYVVFIRYFSETTRTRFRIRLKQDFQSFSDILFDGGSFFPPL